MRCIKVNHARILINHSGTWYMIVNHARIILNNSRMWQIVVGGAYFTQMAITQEVNEISSPKSVHMCMGSIWGHNKQFYGDRTIGGAITVKKL